MNDQTENYYDFGAPYVGPSSGNNNSSDPYADISSSYKKSENTGGSERSTSVKKPAVIIIVAVFAFLICAIGVVGGLLIFTSQDSSGKIVELLENGHYDEAYDLYAKKYGNGNSDNKLEAALHDRLCDLEDEYKDDEITKKKALEEVEIIEKMDIDALEKDINITREYIEKLKEDSSSDSNTSTPVVPETEYVGAEVLPPKEVSSTPYISSASTLAGTVLPASNEDSRRSFGADKAIDNAYDSCWCVNTSSEGGAGAKIQFNLADTSYVNGVRIINGNNFHPEEGIFRSNGQVKSFTVTFSDGSSHTFTASYNGNQRNTFEDFALPAPVKTDYIILTVNSGYVGAKYTTNVCLGEFDVY